MIAFIHSLFVASSVDGLNLAQMASPSIAMTAGAHTAAMMIPMLRSVTHAKEPPRSSRAGRLSAFKSPARDRITGVNKVDVMEARKGLYGSVGRHPSGRVTHAPYRREPYICVQLPDGGTVDAKAAAWTRTHVLAHWRDDDGQVFNVWVEAGCVRRIAREESGWRDTYDLDW